MEKEELFDDEVNNFRRREIDKSLICVLEHTEIPFF